MTESENNPKFRYWVLEINSGDEDVFLSGLPEGGPEDCEYTEGVELSGRHPVDEDGGMCFDPAWPDGVKLRDFVGNLNKLIIGNSKVKKILDDFSVDNVEYLPVWLYDHQDKLVSKDYFIVNLLGRVDIIDLEKSKVRMSRIDKTQISKINSLILNLESIPEQLLIFRASSKLNLYFVRDDLKKAFLEAELSGVNFVTPEEWRGI